MLSITSWCHDSIHKFCQSSHGNSEVRCIYAEIARERERERERATYMGSYRTKITINEQRAATKIFNKVLWCYANVHWLYMRKATKLGKAATEPECSIEWQLFERCKKERLTFVCPDWLSWCWTSTEHFYTTVIYRIQFCIGRFMLYTQQLLLTFLIFITKKGISVE